MDRYGVIDTGRICALCRNLESVAAAPETTYMFLAHAVRSVRIGTLFIGEGEVVASRRLVTGILATYQARFSCEGDAIVIIDSVGEVGVKGEEQV